VTALRRLLILVALLSIASLPARSSAAAELTLHVFDVGQGDGMLIISPAGKTVLVDGGPPEASARIAARVKDLVHGPLDLMLMTHPHLDHLGGLAAVLDAVGARMFMEPSFSHPSPAYNELLKALQNKGVALKVGEAGRNIDLGGGASMHLLAPKQPGFHGTRSDANANSIVVRLTFGKTAFYLSADSELETEQAILASGEEIASDVYKVAHHGSRHSSSAELLAKIHPRIAVVSVGANNDYGHPTRAALDRLEAVHAEVLRTDLDGEIVLVSNGEKVTYRTEKGDGLAASGPAVAAVEDKPAPTPSPTPTPAPTAHHKGNHDPKPAKDPVASDPAPKVVAPDPTPAPKPTPAPTPAPSAGGAYVASKNSQVFHKPECNNASRIKPENVLKFSTREEAIASGRRPAKDCNP
jgi:beta-lactamase superfamily II metal-dependent hydrolase